MLRVGRRAVVELAIVGLALVAAFVPMAAGGVERWFSTGMYPALQHAITPVSNLLPVALFDVLAGAAFAIAFGALCHAARLAWRTRRALPALRVVGHLAAGAALMYVMFLLVWGLNYRRVPMFERLLVESGSPAPEAVVQLGLDAASALNTLHDRAHRSGWRREPWEDADLRRAFADVQRELSEAPPAVPGRLKHTLLGPYFRWAGIDGMINPFGLEALANPDLLPFERPFVAAHEWAHLAGYADEAEASFVGWLACIRADSEAQYSGWLALSWQVNSEVSQSARVRLARALDAGPRRDVEAIAARLRRGQWPWLRNAGWRVYDRYLKANRVEQGVASYGGVVTLILRARFGEGWRPVRRRQ